MNLLRVGTKLLLQKTTGKKIPFQVGMHITDRCNLRCKYCYIDFDHAYKDMSLEGAKKIITGARECGTERISLQGGEPLAHKNIGDMVNLIKDLGMECNINTNGFFVPRRFDEIKRTDFLSVSLDGDEEAHDSVRGEGSFDKAIEAVKLARAQGIRVNILSVLNRKNRGSINFLLSLVREYDCFFVPSSVLLNPVVDSHGQDQIDDFMLDDEEYRLLLDELIEKKAQGHRIVWSEENMRYVQSWPLTFRISNLFTNKIPDGSDFEPIKCYAGTAFCTVQTNGDLYTCDPILAFKAPNPPNAIELGFKEAFERIPLNVCKACNYLGCSELNRLFSIDIPSILSMKKLYDK